MNPYAANPGTQSLLWGRIWKIIVGLAAMIPAGVLLMFFYCKSRLDRGYYQGALEVAHRVEDMRQLDTALLPKFEKEVEGHDRARYIARPHGQSICGCSPAVIDVVEVTYDGGGQISSLSVSQSIGLSKPGPSGSNPTKKRAG